MFLLQQTEFFFNEYSFEDSINTFVGTTLKLVLGGQRLGIAH